MQQRNRSASTHSSKRVFRARHFSKHTNLQRTQTTSNSLSNSWTVRIRDISVALLHAAAATDDLHMYPPSEFYNRSDEIVWKLTESLANKSSRCATAGFQQSTADPSNLLHAAAQRLHTWMSYFFLKRRQQQTRFSKQFSNTCFLDEQDATLPTEETTMNLDWQTATTTHFLRKQKWRTANQQQLQEQHRTPTADHKQPLSKD